MEGKSKDSFCGQTNEIIIPVWVLRIDCQEYYKYLNSQQGFKKSAQKKRDVKK